LATQRQHSIYSGASNTAGYSLANNQINYISASAGDNFTLNGVASTSGLSISGNVVTVANSALNQSTVTISDGYSLALADDVVTPATSQQATWSISGNTASYKNSATSAGYSIFNNQINYITAGGGETLITVNGVKDTGGLSINDKVVTVAASALN